MTTVLALYPGTLAFRQEQIVRHRRLLTQLGVRVVIADDWITDADRELFDDAIVLPPPEQVGEACRTLERFFREQRVDALLAQSEPALLPGAILASRHGLAGVSPRAAHACANKLACRRALERAGVPQPRFTLASDEAGVRAFARGAGGGYPVVLKGVCSSLGRLVTLVPDEAAVERAVQALRRGLPESLDIVRLRSFAEATGLELGCEPEREFLVESFAPGDPLETDGILVGSLARSFGVTAQVISAPPWFFVEGYLLPADRPAQELLAVESVSDRALEALGVRDTGYSIEMRLDRGEVRLIEVNARLGYDEGFGDLFEMITGAHPALQALELALGRQPAFTRGRGVRAALAYQSAYADGIVARVPTSAEVADVEKLGVRIGLGVALGSRMHAPPHPDVSPHLAFALAEHPTSSRAAYEHARAAVDRLRFELSPVKPIPDRLDR